MSQDMNVVIHGKAREFVEHLVQAGAYSSAHALVDDFFGQQQAKLEALRAKLDAAEAEGGEVSEEELDASLAATMEQLRQEGY